jgi:hypothetical protein
MFESRNFTKKRFSLNGNEYKIEYELNNVHTNVYMSFGNIYMDKQKPVEFTFAIADNKILQYVPLNAKKELISNIVQIVMGRLFYFHE